MAARILWSYYVESSFTDFVQFLNEIIMSLPSLTDAFQIINDNSPKIKYLNETISGTSYYANYNSYSSLLKLFIFYCEIYQYTAD